VAASAVIGIADEKSGEIPIAYIELEEGVSELDTSALRKHIRDNLANYKVPKQLHFIDELPKNATGKVLKRKLKDEVIN
jgi:long-chain acyl-CoA synthetase